MTAAEIRVLFALGSRPEVVSPAGGMPNWRRCRWRPMSEPPSRSRPRPGRGPRGRPGRRSRRPRGAGRAAVRLGAGSPGAARAPPRGDGAGGIQAGRSRRPPCASDWHSPPNRRPLPTEFHPDADVAVPGGPRLRQLGPARDRPGPAGALTPDGWPRRCAGSDTRARAARPRPPLRVPDHPCHHMVFHLKHRPEGGEAVSRGSRAMGFVIQMAPGKAEGGSRTGRTRVARQRSRGPSGRGDRSR